jgi:hypothetical protein
MPVSNGNIEELELLAASGRRGERLRAMDMISRKTGGRVARTTGGAKHKWRGGSRAVFLFPPPSLNSVTAISAGGAQTCAIQDGGAWCWGWNGYGQLGNNDRLAGCVIPRIPERARTFGNRHYRLVSLHRGFDRLRRWA